MASGQRKGSLSSNGSTKPALTRKTAGPDDEVPLPTLPEFNPRLAPLYAPALARLKKQLQDAEQRVTLELREKQAQLKQLAKRREDAGVELFGLTNELKKQRQLVVETEALLEGRRSERDAAEQALAETKAELEQLQAALQEKRTEAAVRQKEFDKLSSTVVQAERGRAELAAKLAVSKRETFKAEEDASNMEKQKLEQDLLIDKLTEEAKTLEDRRLLVEAQYAAQKQESNSAAETLNQAAIEMENIANDKKQLLQKWNHALLAIQKRDDALKLSESELNGLEENVRALDAEISGYRKAIDAEQARNEQLTAQMNKMNNSEIALLEREIQKIRETREHFAEQYSQYQRSIEATEQELLTVNADRKRLEEQLSQLQKEKDTISTNTLKLEDRIAENLQLQKTLESSSKGTERSAGKLAANVREKEMQIANHQNELARIGMDLQNSKSRNHSLKEELQTMLSGLKEKDALVQRYELEIKKRNDEIERKQTEVDRLNKKYDQLQTANPDENMGPLEATVHNLTLEIQKRGKESLELQYYWLRSQTELVKLNKEMDRQQEQIQDMHRQLTLAKQRQLRITGSFEAHEKEIREIDNSVRMLQTDMQKLNALIAKNSRLRDFLVEGNMDLENEFFTQLKEAEKAAIQLEQRIDAIREEKHAILQDIVEAERLYLLWQKKYALAKETKEQLDPNIGAADAKALHSEIQRLNAVLSSLKKERDQLGIELDHAVARRESVVVVGSQAKAKQAAAAKNNINRANKELERQLNKLNQDVASVRHSITIANGARSTYEQDLTQVKQQVELLQQRDQELDRQIRSDQEQKTRDFELLRMYQKVAKTYADADKDGVDYDAAEPKVAKELLRQTERRQKILGILKTLESSHPEVIDEFRKKHVAYLS